MSQMTMDEVQNELAALRRRLDDLSGRLAGQSSADGSPTDMVGRALMQDLKESMDRTGAVGGLSVAGIVTQNQIRGGNGTAFGLQTLTKADDLPSEEKIQQKIARLAPFVQEPLLLRTLRLLAAPHFEGQPMRRAKADLAAALGVAESDLERVLTPVLDVNEIRWGKDASGAEFYEWTGNGLPMMLLIQA